MHVAFGDTFSAANMTGAWRSNVLLLSIDTDLADGLSLAADRVRQPVHQGRPGPWPVRLRSRPSSRPPAVSLNDEQYVNYMSVKSWDTPGRWTTNYSAISKFQPGPDGGTWVLVPSTIRSAGLAAVHHAVRRG